MFIVQSLLSGKHAPRINATAAIATEVLFDEWAWHYCLYLHSHHRSIQ